VSQVDLSASLAALTGQCIPAGDAPDSVNVLPALLGNTKNARGKLVEHDGSHVFGFRDGLWKLIEVARIRRPIYSPTGELYDLKSDLGETSNLQSAESGKFKTLSGELDAVKKSP